MAGAVPTDGQGLKELVHAFGVAAQQAGLGFDSSAVVAEFCAAPHRQPAPLPLGRQAIYWFSIGSCCLKVGKAGPQSHARYTSQHYNPGSSGSNLAKSLLSHPEVLNGRLPAATVSDVLGLNASTVGDWIRDNASRCNLLLEGTFDDRALSFLETFVQVRLNPVFEGRIARRAR